MNQIRVVMCTFPDVAEARQIGTVLVEKQLAACVNLLPVDSVYRWQGRVEAASEVLVLFKTSADGFSAFESELNRLHPYEVPEIIALEPTAVAEAYAAWVLNSVAPRDQ